MNTDSNSTSNPHFNKYSVDPRYLPSTGNLAASKEPQQLMSRSNLDDKEPGSIQALNMAKNQSDEAAQNKKKEMVTLLIQLPDGTIYKTLVSPTTRKTAAEALASVCDRVGFSPAEEYELTEISGDNVEKAMANDDSLAEAARRVRDTKGKLALRKKKAVAVPPISSVSPTTATAPVVGQRKLGFMAASRGNTGSASASATPTRNPSVTSISTASDRSDSSQSLETNLAPQSQASTSGASSPNPVNSSSAGTNASTAGGPVPLSGMRTRRLSFHEGLSGLLGLGKSKSEIITPVDQQDAPEAVAREVFLLDATEKRFLSLCAAEVFIQLFANVENHGLSFNKLTERGRFLSWSRSSAAAAKDINTKVFGVPLNTIIEMQHIGGDDRLVPKFFLQCMEYLDANALHVPGIFRISGVPKRIKVLKDDADAGKELNFSEVKPHDVTSLIKMFFREMPDPLFTFKLYDFYIAAAKYLEDEKFDEAIKMLTLLLPMPSLRILKEFFELVQRVSSFSGSSMIIGSTAGLSAASKPPAPIVPALESLKIESSEEADERLADSAEESMDGNLMTSSNLSIVIAPNLLRPKDTKAEKALEDADYVKRVFERLLSFEDSLFEVPASLMKEITIRTRVQQ
eukprot:Partr_v1_DN28635_c1_g2_i3_m49811 putative Rho GTPase activating protein 6